MADKLWNPDDTSNKIGEITRKKRAGNLDKNERRWAISREKRKADTDRFASEEEVMTMALKKVDLFKEWFITNVVNAPDLGLTAEQKKEFEATKQYESVNAVNAALSRDTIGKANSYYLNDISSMYGVSLDKLFDIEVINKSKKGTLRWDLAHAIVELREEEDMNPDKVNDCPYDSAYKFMMNMIDREVYFEKQDIIKVADDNKKTRKYARQEALQLNECILVPHKIQNARMDYYPRITTVKAAKYLQVPRERLNMTRLVLQPLNIQTMVAFCILYDVSLDDMLCTDFARENIYQARLQYLATDYNGCVDTAVLTNPVYIENARTFAGIYEKIALLDSRTCGTFATMTRHEAVRIGIWSDLADEV